VSNHHAQFFPVPFLATQPFVFLIITRACVEANRKAFFEAF
jgi:hypothetical protein